MKLWPFTRRRKTIKQWEKEYNITVLDPDGFDRSDPHLMERLFTREEWERGFPFCTLLLPPDTRGRRRR